VKPDFQKCGIGTKLVDFGMQEVSRLDIDVVFVYGDPNYYSRFGFRQNAAEQYKPPYTLTYPFGWQALVLKQCSTHTGRVAVACVPSLSRQEYW
jgi:putative acetyltransferase